MTVKAVLTVAPVWGEPSLPVKGPLNDILAQRMVKEVQSKMEKFMSEPKKSKNISIGKPVHRLNPIKNQK